MKLTVILLTTLFALSANAGFQGYAGSTNKGLFNIIKCSTGLTCSKVGDSFNMVSSPTLVAPLTLESAEVLSNATDDTVQVASNDEHTTFQILGFENKDAILNLWADQGDDSADKFSIKSSAANVLSINANGTAMMSFSSAGVVTGPGTGAMSGFLNKQVAATATTITAAQCGSTFINAGAIEMELPEASAVLGCRLTFIVGNASNFTIDPDDADSIVLLTNAAGDSLIADAVGESLTIEAISASAWTPVGSEKGTCTDSN